MESFQIWAPYTVDDNAARRLGSWMAKSAAGSSQDLVSPLCDRNSPTQSRLGLMRELWQRMVPTGFAWLDEAESMQMEKIGPYSVMLPYHEREDSVDKYFRRKDFSINQDAMQHAVRAVSGYLPSNSLRLASLDAAFNAMPRGTNLGLPWFSRKSEFYESVRQKAFDVIQSEYSAVFNDPAVLFWRGQPRGLNEVPKQRVVWGFPHDITLLEEMIQLPLLDALTYHPTFSAWVSNDAVSRAVTLVLDDARFDVLSVDFSGFDASIPAILINLAYDIIRGWFVPEARRHIDYVEDRFLNIALLTPSGIRERVNGSVPSGSGLTNMVDTIVQLIAFQYISYLLGTDIRWHLAQGDDGVVSFNSPWNLDEVIELAKTLNLSIGSDKGGVSKERVYYLQNVHDKQLRINGVCQGIRPIMRVLNSSLSYERLRPGSWNGYMDTLRFWQIGENAWAHPQFTKYVDFLYRHDRVSRNYGPREIVSRAGGIEKAKSALLEKPFPYGKKSIGGVMDYHIVHELQRLRSIERRRR